MIGLFSVGFIKKLLKLRLNMFSLVDNKEEILKITFDKTINI